MSNIEGFWNKRYTTDAYEQIDAEELKIASLNRIPQKVFINNYLLGLLTDPVNFRLKWCKEVSSSPFHEVIMVNDSNEVLCIIPPLRVSGIVEEFKNDVLTEAIHMYEKTGKENGMPRQADRALDSLLKKEIKIDMSMTPEIVKRWRDVVILCGYEHLLTETIDGNKSAPVEFFQGIGDGILLD